jgi:hypothetical protein
MPHRELIVRGPTYFSAGDESAFFAWLSSIPCVADITGQSRDLHIRLRRMPSNADLRELVALLYRYKMDMRPLAAMKTPRNTKWFADPKAYWHAKLFGKHKRSR